MELEYGRKALAEEDRTLYWVECEWPDTRSASMKREGWSRGRGFGRYSHTAFNDKRNPGTHKFFSSTVGTFDAENKDVADHPSRVNFGGAVSDRCMAFTDPAAALAYADRLTEFGELASKQDAHQEEFIKAYAEAGPIKTRVVEERTTKLTRLVKRAPKFEWPLEAVA
jgi:hypothetical protein